MKELKNEQINIAVLYERMGNTIDMHEKHHKETMSGLSKLEIRINSLNEKVKIANGRTSKLEIRMDNQKERNKENVKFRRWIVGMVVGSIPFTSGVMYGIFKLVLRTQVIDIVASAPF